MNTNKPQFHWKKLNHHFDRVELVTFKSTGNSCTRSVWGQEESEDLPCQSDDLMINALNEEHSFIYIKSGEIRLIKAWLKDGRFISSYEEFLALLELNLNIGEDNESNNVYLSVFKRNIMDNKQWTKSALLHAWKDVQGVSIGAGANKEMIEVSSFERLLPEFSINLESLIDANVKGNSQIVKAGKYLGRILRPFRYCTLDKPKIEVENTSPDDYDGFSLIDQEFVEKCGLKTGPGDRVEVTMLTEQGLIKGHGEIRNLQNDAVVFGDQFKHQINGSPFCGFEKLKRSTEVHLDIQTIINIPELWKFIPDWIDQMLVDVLTNIRDGKLPEFMNRIDDLDFNRDGSLQREKWVLKRLVQHQIPLIFPWTIRRIWHFYREYLIRPAKLRVKVPGAIRVYLTPDVIDENPIVEPDRCIIRGANLYISRKDKDWICTLLGGADFDDSVVVIPLPNNQVLIYRNPNQFGEWLTLEIQETDHEFAETHDMKLPKSQRWNGSSKDQPISEARERIQAFWDYMKGQPAEECLKSRIPENIIESIDIVAGPLTELFELAKDKIKEADEAVKLYCHKVEIPELFMDRSKLFPVAKELRSEYGKAVSKLIKRAESISDKDERESYFIKQIEKVNARIRGWLTRYSRDEQKLIIKDLAHLCYIALPGSGNDNYTLTQANDGILGIPSSAGERNLGTAHIFIDLLLDLGLGIRIEKDLGEIVTYKSNCPNPLPNIEGNTITMVGGWRRLAERDGYSSLNPSTSIVNKYCTLAYNKINSIKLITVKRGQIVHNSRVIGYTAKSSPLTDGSYSVIKTIPLAKSILLQVFPSA